MPTCQDLFAQRDQLNAEITATAALVAASLAIYNAYVATLAQKTGQLGMLNNQISSQGCT